MGEMRKTIENNGKMGEMRAGRHALLHEAIQYPATIHMLSFNQAPDSFPRLSAPLSLAPKRRSKLCLTQRYSLSQERGRQGRLMLMAMHTNQRWAFGVDEDAAYIWRPDGVYASADATA